MSAMHDSHTVQARCEREARLTSVSILLRGLLILSVGAGGGESGLLEDGEFEYGGLLDRMSAGMLSQL